MTNKLSWASEDIVKSHNYDNNGNIPMNTNFIDDLLEFINNIPQQDTIKIFDIGCGNGRIYWDLKEKLKKSFYYIGVDCNELLINIAKNNIPSNNSEFYHMDIDNADKTFFNKYKNYIFLFESTFSMINKPMETLEKILPITNYILFTRLHVIKPKCNSLQIYNVPHIWDGMAEPSPNWRFSKNLLIKNNSFRYQDGIIIHEKKDEIFMNLYLIKNEKFLFYNYIPTIAKHILDVPLNNYPTGIIPKHNYPTFEVNKIQEGDVIFVKTDLLKIFFNNYYSKIKNKFILISGVGGKDVDIFYKCFLDNNSKIITWIGCNLLFEHPKCFKIPIGFEEPERRINGPADGEGGDQKTLEEMFNNKKKIQDKYNKLLITYIGNTHSSRQYIKEHFTNKDFVYFADKLRFKDYMTKINEYKFVLCPRGCGTDTHRFWEVLLMGSIPVIEKDGLYSLYEKFPCIIIDNFQDVTIEMLNNFQIEVEKQENIEKFLLIRNFQDMILSHIEKCITHMNK